jgi:hypothetical protein
LAYLNLLAAVTESQVNNLRADATIHLSPSLLVGVSHLIAYWVSVQPLGTVLGQAIDGGDLLNDVLEHPFRSPVFHSRQDVVLLEQKLTVAWREALAGAVTNELTSSDDWYRIEIEKVLRLYKHAVERDECVVSALDESRRIFA